MSGPGIWISGRRIWISGSRDSSRAQGFCWLTSRRTRWMLAVCAAVRCILRLSKACEHTSVLCFWPNVMPQHGFCRKDSPPIDIGIVNARNVVRKITKFCVFSFSVLLLSTNSGFTTSHLSPRIGKGKRRDDDSIQQSFVVVGCGCCCVSIYEYRTWLDCIINSCK